MSARTAAVAALLVAGSVFLAGTSAAQSTRPERTDFRETSSYDDVVAFLDSLQLVAPEVKVGTLATSVEGRKVPFVIAARPSVSAPAEAHRTGKVIVYLQANIHAGEVEGKEAAQMLLRAVTLGSLRPLLDQIVLLVVPIYNADGNERWASGEHNRPGQNGPERVGQNPNGQGLNLNRDYVKMEAPETRGAASLLATWDPDLFIDLHTTNGSYHGYVLTYAPGLNPNSNPASEFVRDRFLPVVRQRMQQRHAQRTFWYGNFRNQDPDSLAQGWETYDARPRFGTNWMGLAGTAGSSQRGLQQRRLQDPHPGYVQLRPGSPDPGGRAAGDHQVIGDGFQPAPAATRWPFGRSSVRPRHRTWLPRSPTRGVRELVGLPGGSVPGCTAPFACRYSIASSRRGRSGCRLDTCCPPDSPTWSSSCGVRGFWWTRCARQDALPVETFAVDSLAVNPLFEGHRTVQVEGRWSDQAADTLVTAGWYLVRTDQPLGVLAAYLLEPASEDGLVTWNFLDRELQVHAPYPILRVGTLPRIPALAVP